MKLFQTHRFTVEAHRPAELMLTIGDVLDVLGLHQVRLLIMALQGWLAQQEATDG
jgi:hypothetical protein